MAPIYQVALLGMTVVLAGGEAGLAADAACQRPAPGAVLTFNDAHPDTAFGLEQFWPMDRAHGWTLDKIPAGSYRIVVRVASQKAMHGRPTISADDAEREFGTDGKGLVVKDSAGPRSGFVAIQLIDLGDLGIDSTTPLRLRVSFQVKTRNNGRMGTMLPREHTIIPGKLVSLSPKSKPRWLGGELGLYSFWVHDARTGIGIRYDVLLVRDGSGPKK
jgi:hypothetical protein